MVMSTLPGQATGIQALAGLGQFIEQERKQTAMQEQAQQQEAQQQEAQQMLVQAMQLPNNNPRKQQAINQIAVQYPDMVKGLLDIQPKQQESKPFQMGSGDLTGYSFDPNSGQFSISPEIKQSLEKRRQEATLKNGVIDAKTRQGINKDITQLTKDTKLIANTAKDLDKLAKMKTGPASIAMVFKFMKALDPTSVVREGEFATAANSGGIPESVMNYYNRLMQGDILPEKAKREFLTTSKQLANNAIDSSKAEVTSFLDTFEDTIPEGFKKLTTNRIPKRFEVEPMTETPQTELSIDDLVNKYGN